MESNRLQDIVNSSEPALFIMNHTDKQGKDIQAAKFFNTLLYREYIYHNKAETCPRSKVLANQGVLDRQQDKGEFYKWLGVVPIKAGINYTDKEGNRNTIKILVDEFVKKKINLFMFPEGALAVLANLPLEYKFQPGAAAFVKKVLDVVSKIKVVPIGFAHKNDQTAIHIGEPIIFAKRPELYMASAGNAKDKNFDSYLAHLYQDRDFVFIKDNGHFIREDGIVPYLSGIMVENLKCCIKNAQRDLQNIKPEVYDI